VKDPTIPDPASRKKFMFYDTEKRQVDLRIRLRYDGLNQSHFFRAMITGYLEKDPGILSYLDYHRGKYQIQGINKREGSHRLIKRGQEVEQKFGLVDSDDIDNIYDILEQENPDL